MDDSLARLRSERKADLPMAAAGILMTSAFLISYTRLDAWAAFPKLMLVAIPCLLLFAAALAPAGNAQSALDEGPLSRWQATFIIAGLFLLELVLAQFADLLTSPGAGTALWTLVAVAALAAFFAHRADLPAATLIAALAIGGAFIALVDKIDSDASASAYRDILILVGLILIFVSRVTRAKMIEHSHVLAATGAFYVIVAAIIGVLGELNTGLGLTSALAVGSGFGSGNGSNGWELVLLIAAIGAAVYAGIEGYRGAGFVAIFGLIAFFGLAVRGNLFGWPLILILLAGGAAFYAMSLVEGGGSRPARRQEPSNPEPPAAAPPGGPTGATEVRDAPPAPGSAETQVRDVPPDLGGGSAETQIRDVPPRN